jgi:glycosyltransferase involved in cell wall biosynthesis
VRVLIVSGIWPPDVGGPASHAPAVADFLTAHGHAVEVVVTADGKPGPRPYPVRWTPRRIPVGLRHLHTLALLLRRSARADVVYTTGMFGRSGIAARLTRTPIVVKLTGDPAFERLRARGAVGGDVDTFQSGGGGRGARVLRALRDDVVRRAAHVYAPSSYLAQLAIGWGAASDRVSVLPNPGPSEVPAASREELRVRLGLDGPTVAFAGRLTAQKSLDVLVQAVAACEGVSLVIAGDGGEREPTEALVERLGLTGRVRLVGPLDRTGVLELFAAADAAVLASSWENFPHTVVEALAVGTPVIATRVGGVPEVVADGANGLLVPPGDPAALAAAVTRYFADTGLRERLRAAAVSSVEAYRPERLFGELERALEEAAAR